MRGPWSATAENSTQRGAIIPPGKCKKEGCTWLGAIRRRVAADTRGAHAGKRKLRGILRGLLVSEIGWEQPAGFYKPTVPVSTSSGSNSAPRGRILSFCSLGWRELSDHHSLYIRTPFLLVQRFSDLTELVPPPLPGASGPPVVCSGVSGRRGLLPWTEL